MVVNTILRGDAIEHLNLLSDATIDLTVFSPPYDGVRDYGKDWSIDRVGLGRQIYRVTKDGGVCAVVLGDGTKDFAKSLTTFRWAIDWVDHAGWRLFETCIYHRHGNPGAWWSKRFRVDHEFILIFFRGDRPKHFDKSTLTVPSKHAGKIWSGSDRLTNGELRPVDSVEVQPTKCRGTVWNYATSNSEGNRLKLKHPATFPDNLAADLVRCFSKPGDLVLDPMCGSGTTCVMAASTGRNYIGIEINPDYVQIAKDRVSSEVSVPLGRAEEREK